MFSHPVLYPVTTALMKCANYSQKAFDSRYPEALLIALPRRCVNLASLQKQLKKVRRGKGCWIGEGLPVAFSGLHDGPPEVLTGNCVQISRRQLYFRRYCLGDMPVALRKATQKLLTLR